MVIKIKKILFLVILLSLNSCYGMCFIEPKFTEEAVRLYNLPTTRRVWLSYDEARKIFGDCYRSTDRIFVADNIYKRKYILVRFGEPITYEDEKVWFGF